MKSSTSSLYDDKYAVGILLILALFLGWLLGLKNLATEWANATEETASHFQPNILLIVVDDLGYNDTDAINPGGIETPHITSLAREGVTFTRHYADATCTPSRVALLTGRHPERSGFRPIGMEIPAEFPTIAQQLERAGYATYLTGKWHAGEDRRESWPDHKGFPTWFGFLNQWETSGEVTEENKGGRKRPTYIDPMLRTNGGDLQKHSGHLTDLLTQHSIGKIKELRGSDKPWFLYHAFLAPHHPIQPADRYRARFADTPEGEYTALVTQLDDAIGELVAAVDQQNTLIVFVSDNGGTNKQRDNNYPFYGKKGDIWEGAFRTPLIINWPENISSDSVIDDVAMNVDLYPTLLAAAGVPASEQVDGRNLWPTISSGAALSGRNRSWEVFVPSVSAASFSFLSASGDWRLASQQGLQSTLYHLAEEPSGKHDVASENPEKVAELTKEFWIEYWRKSLLDVTVHRKAPDLTAHYTGFDAMRTPYRYGLAIGLELGPLPANLQDGSATSMTTLAGQEGFWELRYSRDTGLEWEIGDQVLRDASFEPSACNAIVLTNYFQPLAHLATRAPRSQLKLYSAGHLRDYNFQFDYRTIAGTVLETPTYVKYGGRAVFSNMLLSSFSDPYSPNIAADFSEIFTQFFKEKKLSLADVKMMDAQLCQES